MRDNTVTYGKGKACIRTPAKDIVRGRIAMGGVTLQWSDLCRRSQSEEMSLDVVEATVDAEMSIGYRVYMQVDYLGYVY